MNVNESSDNNQLCFDDRSPHTTQKDETNSSSPTGFGLRRKLGDKVDPIRIKLGSTVDISPEHSS